MLMRIITLLLALLFVYSCKTTQPLKISASKDFGVEWTFSKRVNESYMESVDSMITISLLEFNKEDHPYKFHKKKATDTEYVTLHFTNGKKVSPKQKRNGYILSGIGLIGIPTAMVVANLGFVVGFYYFPLNTIDAKVSMSPVITDSVYRYKKLRVQTGSLFKPNEVQVQKLFTKFQTRFAKLLLELNNKLEKEKNRGM
jgi:hypothetical protein